MAEWLWGLQSWTNSDKDRQLDESVFSGGEGATSLKGKIVSRLPVLNDAASVRAARNLLTELGGPAALFEELVVSGFVDSQTGLLVVDEKPFNVFAHVAAGKMVQHQMIPAQSALGKYEGKYVVVANQPQNDLHWDSNREEWIKRASMGKRHKFLTTKNLHWQWFNALVFGLVNPDQGGVSPAGALAELEQMKAAALEYAKNIGGWSENIGLFVNIFGHNNVNSLFIHIVDMDELGPAFKHQEHKSCPVDDVLKILQEDVVSKLLPSPAISMDRINALKREAGWKMMLQGKEGATSIKEELTAVIPKCRDASSYRESRRLLVEDLGGIEALKNELQRAGFLEANSSLLSTGTKPFSIFARIAAGKTIQEGMEQEQDHLGDFKSHFLVACNLPANDMHWDDDDPQWVGKASMSKHHRFLVLRDLHWQWFNALVFGLIPPSDGGKSLRECIARIELMKAAAMTYARKAGWSQKVGLFFHVFGHNTVNAFHLHMIDMNCLGPTFWFYEYKNCPLDVVLKVLKEELELEAVPQGPVVSTNSMRMGIAESKSMMRKEMKQTHIFELNVGGQTMTVPLSTFMAAPPTSLLHKFFVNVSGDSWACPLPQDSAGRLFLNYPHAAFAILVDHLRLLKFTPSNKVVEPPIIWEKDAQEVELLAWHLGVAEILEKPQWGQAPMCPQLEDDTIRPRSWILKSFCQKRQRAPPPRNERPKNEMQTTFGRQASFEAILQLDP